MAIPFTVTNAGITWLEAQLSAGHDAPLGYVRLFQDEVTPSATTTALTNPFNPDKRFSPVNILNDVAGNFVLEVVAPLPSAEYSAPTAGLYSTSDTLLGVASQPTLIRQPADRQLRIRWGFNLSGTAVSSVTFSTSGVLPATESLAGIVERATTAEAIAGSDNLRYMTPALVQSALGALPHFQRFTESGTWNKPDNATAVYVEVYGGGASGQAFGNVSSGGKVYGGEAGGVSRQLIPADQLPATVTVTVGNGGDATVSVGGSAADSEQGYDSSFGTVNQYGYVLAKGARSIGYRKDGDYNLDQIVDLLIRNNDTDFGGGGGRITGNHSSNVGELSANVRGGEAGTSGSIDGDNGRDAAWGKGSGGGAGYYGASASDGGRGGIPSGGGGAGRERGGAGGRGEVRVWTF